MQNPCMCLAAVLSHSAGATVPRQLVMGLILVTSNCSTCAAEAGPTPLLFFSLFRLVGDGKMAEEVGLGRPVCQADFETAMKRVGPSITRGSQAQVEPGTYN